MAALRESVMRLWAEQGWGTPARQHLFIKDAAPDMLIPVNHWGVYQALRWTVGASRGEEAGFFEGARGRAGSQGWA